MNLCRGEIGRKCADVSPDRRVEVDGVLQVSHIPIIMNRTERLQSETANHFPHRLQLRSVVSEASTSKCWSQWIAAKSHRAAAYPNGSLLVVDSDILLPLVPLSHSQVASIGRPGVSCDQLRSSTTTHRLARFESLDCALQRDYKVQCPIGGQRSSALRLDDAHSPSPTAPTGLPLPIQL